MAKKTLGSQGRHGNRSRKPAHQIAPVLGKQRENKCLPHPLSDMFPSISPPPQTAPPGGNKVSKLCAYGGHFILKPHTITCPKVRKMKLICRNMRQREEQRSLHASSSHQVLLVSSLDYVLYRSWKPGFRAGDEGKVWTVHTGPWDPILRSPESIGATLALGTGRKKWHGSSSEFQGDALSPFPPNFPCKSVDIVHSRLINTLFHQQKGRIVTCKAKLDNSFY